MDDISNTCEEDTKNIVPESSFGGLVMPNVDIGTATASVAPSFSYRLQFFRETLAAVGLLLLVPRIQLLR